MFSSSAAAKGSQWRLQAARTMLQTMAAKNKRPKRTMGLDRIGPDVRNSFTLQARASEHRDELLEEARTLLTSGKVREARAVEKRAGQIEQLVGALEAEVRPPNPDSLLKA